MNNFVGPIRTEIEILPADPIDDPCPLRINSRGKMNKYNGIKLGWKIHETIGIAVINTRGLTKTSVVK